MKILKTIFGNKSDCFINNNIYNHILIACFQKSGSTYLSRLLCKITEYELVGFNEFGEHNEQDICSYTLLKTMNKNTVTQQHLKGTYNNINKLKEYNLKPIILTRNINDVLISLYDHIERESHMMPTGYIHKEYFHMVYEEKLLYLIKIHLPWYFNFYVSWIEASSIISVMWLSYEEVFKNQIEVLDKIFEFYEMKMNKELVLNAIENMKNIDTRLNVGISGRGEELDNSLKGEIIKIAECWQMDASLMKRIGVII